MEHDSVATLGLLSALKAKIHIESATKMIDLQMSAEKMRERIVTLECGNQDSQFNSAPSRGWCSPQNLLSP